MKIFSIRSIFSKKRKDKVLFGISSIQVTTATNIRVIFTKAATVTTAGWSFLKNGSNLSISNLTGSGTTWNFTVPTIAVNDTVTVSYNQTTGNTLDAFTNELPTLITSAVTNTLADTTPPTVSSISTLSTTNIQVVFSEVVSMSALGWSFKVNGVNNNITGLSGSGTTWIFSVETAMANGNTLLYSYDSATGATIDVGLNELASITDASVTNTIPAGDSTPPTVSSKTANSATTIQIVFSEASFVSTLGWSFKQNGNNLPIVSVNGSGTTWTFLISGTLLPSDTILVSYDNSSVGGTTDASGNELATFTDSAVTNSVPDTVAPTISSIATTSTTNIRVIFSENVTATTAGWSFKKNGSALTLSSVSGATTTWNFTVGTMAYGDVLVATYNSVTGATVDTSSNELVSFIEISVTNNIPDTTAPTITSIATQSTTSIRVVFSENVTVTTTGWSFKKNGSNLAISSVSGSGTTWTFVVATMAAGDTLLYSYALTGNTIDTAGNELAAVTDAAVTNSISDVTPPTVSSKTTASTTTITIVFSESVTVTTSGWSFKKNGSALSTSGVSGSGTTWTFTVAAYTGNDILLVSYNSATGNTIDAASNELVSFTDSSIPNTIPITSFAYGSIWKYRDDGVDLSTSWRGTSFDDSTWASGPGRLGYGDGNESTITNYGPDPNNKYRTTYFRKTVIIATAGISSFTFDLKYDDGAVVYVNGTEVGRVNITGTVVYSTFADSANEFPTPYSFSVPVGSFVNGTNVIAVEMHQGDLTSSDLGFDLAITSVGADVTAPTVSSMNTASTTTIVVVFSESVTATTAGWSFKKNGGALSTSGVSGSGTTWTFTVAAMANGDTIQASYTSTTGNTIDAASNELVTFTDAAVTNNIPASDVTAPTVSSATALTTTTIRIIFNESVVATTAGWSFKKNGSNLAISNVSGSGTTWTFTVATMALGDTILRSYNSGTGNTLDLASNELASFTDQPVTNSISTDPVFTATVTAATIQSAGVSPNNADNSSQLNAVTNPYKGSGKPSVVFQFPAAWAGLTIKYTANNWLDQIDIFKVEGNNVKFQCTSTDANSAGRQSTNNSGCLINYPTAGGAFPQGNPGYKFNTVAAGASTITLQAGVGVFQQGDKVLIGGYEDQTQGYPPNERFVEWNTVASISGSNVTFTTPLKYGYNQDWQDWGTPQSPLFFASTDPKAGKPRIFKLYPVSTGNPRGYTTYAWFKDCIFVRNPNQNTMENWATTPIRYISDTLRLTNVTSEDVWTSENRYVIIEGGSYAIAEFDKYTGTIICTGVNFPGTFTNNNAPASLSGSTGVDRLECYNCTFGNFAIISPNEAYFEGCTFVSRDGNPNVAPHPEGTWIKQMEFKNCSFSYPGAGTPHVRLDFIAYQFTSNGGSANTVTFAGGTTPIVGFGGFKALGPGPIRTTGGITATVTDITWNGSNYVVALTGVAGGTPASGQTWQFNREHKAIDLGGNTSVQGKTIFQHPT